MHYIFRETITSFYRSPILTVLSISMISLALYILGLFALGTYNFYLALNEMEERIQIVAYLRDVATVEDISDLRDTLNTLPEVSATQFVTKDEALAKANNELPEFRDIFSELRNNPLPASLEIQLVPESRTPEGTNNVVSHIESHRIIEGIEYGQEWVSTFFALSRIRCGIFHRCIFDHWCGSKNQCSSEKKRNTNHATRRRTGSLYNVSLPA